MAKKNLPLTEIYIIIDSDEKYQGKFNDFIDAQICIENNDMDGASIMKVVQVWEANFPQDPEMEFRELTLEQV